MILSSGTKRPKIHSSAYVAPTATISGEVTIGPESAILHGAVLTAEGAPVTIGAHTVVMENAVLKASGGSALTHPLSIGDRCIIGPGAYVVGASVGDGCVVASGAKVFNGAKLENGSGVAIGAIVEVDEEVAARSDAGVERLAKIFNLESGDDVRGRAAETYAKFLRKAHAQDSALEEHRNVKPPPRRRSGEEPPPTQATQVDKVVDVMMLELEEMEHRRQEAIRRQKGR
ncbi:MAG TPA: DapH/DapD/GlmU-related protein [Candidatus Nitrosotalea sp.]|nr:DapH/DapD/GlmU-related protein [Candidatus Nitrosotalea sp.]